MTTLDRIKKIIEKYNPLAIRRRNKMRRQLVNHSITFLAPNCIGGILFHDLNLKFMSPTVNLMMTQTDFLQFVLHLDEYLKGDFCFYEDTEYSCPCAYLRVVGLPDISVHFTHYTSGEDAVKRWNARKERINRENMFIFIEERDGITENDLRLLSTLQVKGIVAFTCNQYENMPYSVYLPQYHMDGEVGNILRRNYIDDSREYEKIFDFVSWFNEADGEDYNVEKFVKKR